MTGFAAVELCLSSSSFPLPVSRIAISMKCMKGQACFTELASVQLTPQMWPPRSWVLHMQLPEDLTPARGTPTIVAEHYALSRAPRGGPHLRSRRPLAEREAVSCALNDHKQTNYGQLTTGGQEVPDCSPSRLANWNTRPNRRSNWPRNARLVDLADGWERRRSTSVVWRLYSKWVFVRQGVLRCNRRGCVLPKRGVLLNPCTAPPKRAGFYFIFFC